MHLSRTMLFSALFSFSYVVASPAATVLEKLEASVNNDAILKSDLHKFRRTLPLRAQLDPLFAGTALASKGAAATDPEIVNFLIDERLILQTFPLTDAEVEQEITGIQANNRITREQLRDALKAQGFAFDEYFDLIRIGAAKRNLIDREIRTKVSISDDDIRNYYFNHYNRKKAAPRNYSLRIIAINPARFPSPADARKAADEALTAIRSGESFEAVAKKFSHDPSAAQGGGLPVLAEDQLSPQIKTQLKKLQIGQTSEVFGSDKTQWAIVKLVDIRSSDDSEIKRLEGEIRAALATGEYQRQLTLWIERQRQNAFIHRAGEPPSLIKKS